MKSLNLETENMFAYFYVLLENLNDYKQTHEANNCRQNLKGGISWLSKSQVIRSLVEVVIVVC